HLRQVRGDAELLFEVHGGAGRLLAVAQGGVEDDDAVLVGRPFVGTLLVGGGHGGNPFRRIRLKGWDRSPSGPAPIERRLGGPKSRTPNEARPPWCRRCRSE